MNSTQRLWVLLLAVLLVGLGLGLVILGGVLGIGLFLKLGDASGNGTPAPAPLEGRQAPDFRLDALSGQAISLSDFRGHPVLINFWASWCGPCVAEMPMIEARYRVFAPDLVVLAINAGESRDDVSGFVAANQFTFPVLLDLDGQAQELYRVRAYPASYFVDASGIIQVVRLGSMSKNSLDSALEKIGLEP